VIGVDHSPSRRGAVGEGHLQGTGDQTGGLVVIDRPAHDAAGERVEHDRAVQLALPGRVFSDVGDPEPVGLFACKVAVDEIRGCGCLMDGAVASAASSSRTSPGKVLFLGCNGARSAAISPSSRSSAMPDSATRIAAARSSAVGFFCFAMTATVVWLDDARSGA